MYFRSNSIPFNETNSFNLNEQYLQKIRISVIIPTRNHEDQLKKCLAALEGQTRIPEQIIVISESDFKENLVLGTHEINLKYFYSDKRIGPSALRNIGIQHCLGDIVIFLDDDSIPLPNFIENISLPFLDQKIGILRGKVRATNSISINFAPHYDLGEKFLEISPRLLLLCCMAIRKHILDEYGGFDENIPYGHEEADLGYRMSYHGYQSFYTPKAIVYHNYSNSVSHYLKKRFKWGMKRHQLKKHRVKMIGRNRIILNLFPLLSLILLAVFYKYKSSTIFFAVIFFLLAPLIFWVFRGLIAFRNPILALIFGLGEVSGDIGFLIGFIFLRTEQNKNSKDEIT